MLRGMCGPSKCKHGCPAELRGPAPGRCSAGLPAGVLTKKKKSWREEDPAEHLEEALSTHGSSSECFQSQQCQHQLSTLAHGFPGSLQTQAAATAPARQL